jgi:molybdate transport system substrate-binding protein
MFSLMPALRACVASLLLVAALVAPSFAADIRVYSGGAPKEVLAELTPRFEKQTGHKVHYTFAVIAQLQQRLAGGEKPDMVLMPVPALDNLIKAGTLRAEPRPVLGSVGIALIVREGAPRPDISTMEKFKSTLLGARSVVHANPKATPSGAHMARVLESLGIAAAMQGKTVHRNALDGGVELVAKGEAEMGIYPASEVHVKGVALAGMLPKEAQLTIVYGAAVLAANPHAEPAVAFIRFLADPANRAHWKEAGFDSPE